ncbi:hypothetical protein QUB68_00715 [Microcoleus sp. A006_D1]|uniref:hypothetical protein n=1 Tax=Microcoleus sp. A006_D1 TaxID=3055267 RepID=UPI002FD3208B
MYYLTPATESRRDFLVRSAILPLSFINPQRLKECYQQAAANKGQQRPELDLSSCSAPLLLRAIG